MSARSTSSTDNFQTSRSWESPRQSPGRPQYPPRPASRGSIPVQQVMSFSLLTANVKTLPLEVSNKLLDTSVVPRMRCMGEQQAVTKSTAAVAGTGMCTMGYHRMVVIMVAVAVVMDMDMVLVARTTVVRHPLFSTSTRDSTVPAVRARR